MKEIPEVFKEHYFKVPVVNTPEYTIKFEEHYTQGTFIHCDVRKWSKSVCADLQQAFAVLTILHGGPIHALHDSRDRKHEKFLKLFGFAKAKDLADSQELWIWRN